nr:hypothetical protein CFP56_03737 [Quercus suber]
MNAMKFPLLMMENQRMEMIRMTYGALFPPLYMGLGSSSWDFSCRFFVLWFFLSVSFALRFFFFPFLARIAEQGAGRRTAHAAEESPSTCVLRLGGGAMRLDILDLNSAINLPCESH